MTDPESRPRAESYERRGVKAYPKVQVPDNKGIRILVIAVVIQVLGKCIIIEYLDP